MTPTPAAQPLADVHPLPHRVPYILIFAVLIALTVVTVLVAQHRFHSEFVNVVLALLVASVKAALVAMYFMHLKFEGKLIYFIAGVPLFLCVVLVASLIPDVLHGPLVNDVHALFRQAFATGVEH